MNTKHKLQNAPAGDLLLIPLSQLRPSRRNVRCKAHRPQRKESIAQLAESIARVGLLQNLVVTADPDGETYNIEAGARRYAAMRLLVKQKRLDKEAGVPCRPVAEASARTASLTENVQREAMHPADEFEAFAALVAEGRAIEDIAADFGVTPIVVKRRLKLANVSRRLMDDYRGGVVTLEQLMALAITDDHAAQEAAFYDAPAWQRDPATLREHLTEREIDAARDPLARFVGVDAYEQAGAVVTVDAQGEVVVHRGLLQEDVAKVLRALERGGGSVDDVEDAARAPNGVAPAKRGISEALARRLSAPRTAALQIELARRPQVALAALVCELAGGVLLDGAGRSLPLGIRASEPEALTRHGDDLAQSEALRAFGDLRERWRQRLPEDGEALFGALLAKSSEQLVELLAVCVAATVDVVTRREDSDEADALARAVGLDMRAWWTATADGYFRHVPKANIVSVAPEFAPDYGDRLSTLKKDELVANAERLAAGKGWLPPMFARQAAWIDPQPDSSDTDEHGTADADADAEQEVPSSAMAA